MNPTTDYLKESITGEFNAARKYERFSEIARGEGYDNVSVLFGALAKAEVIHKNNHLNALEEPFTPETQTFESGNTVENLTQAISGEDDEYTRMYPQFRKSIRSGKITQRDEVALLSMKWAMEVEKTHSKWLNLALKQVKAGQDITLGSVYVCRICGNLEITNDQPNPICPVCGHDASFYKPMKKMTADKPVSEFVDKFHLQGGEIIRQITFGMNDGVVSIFALLAGVAGAGQSPQTILIALLAATVAGALSMAAGEFISSKSENDYYNHEISQERLEIKLVPEMEREEIRKIYRHKGFSGELLEQIVSKLTEDEDRWAKEMVIDELGVTELEHQSGLKSALVIFVAFIAGACFPVLPYVVLLNTSLASLTIFYIATIITVAGLFIAGAMKRFVTGVNWLKSGIEMLLVGAFAYGISYIIGSLIPLAG